MARRKPFQIISITIYTVKCLIGMVLFHLYQRGGVAGYHKYFTENCGLLGYLQPGDVILADRGFTVQDSVGLYCAEVKVPPSKVSPFTRGKKQLSRSDVDTARQLSCVRIHVERVIGVIRQKYTILESTLPINMIMCDKETQTSFIYRQNSYCMCCAMQPL